MAESYLPEDINRFQIILLLILSVSMVSSASILIRFSTSNPLVIVFWRTLFGGVLMASAGLARNDFRKSYPIVRKRWKWLLVIGVILSLHFSFWFTSLFLTTVAASVVLVNTSPIFTAILSTLVLKEALGTRSWIGVITAVIGSIILAFTDLNIIGIDALFGDILALLAGLFLALYFIGGRKYAKGLPITVYTSIIYFTAALVTLAICVFNGVNVLVLEFSEYLIFIALAIFPTALGHSVNNYLLTLVPAYVVSSAVLGEPIGATILAAVFLGEIPSTVTFIGFGIILLGIALVLVDIAARTRGNKSSLDNTDRS
ncbi:MAG: EamA family transporter [Candidatus Lokiarchaeota archaeon]|nr:EamA family transporter [Candidatus Lokiarchaeota archaeon]